MKIRAYQKNDESEVIALWSLCGLVVPWNHPKADIERKLKVDPELFLVAEEDKKVIATCMGGYDGHRGWINYLAVHPDSRRKGIGKNLVFEIEERVKKSGCPKINLQVRTTNSQVIAFYKAIGFCDDHVTSLGKRLIDDEEYIP